MIERQFNRILVLGIGGVGELAARLLHTAGFQVTGMDIRPPASSLPFDFIEGSVTGSALQLQMKHNDAVLSCLPYHLNRDVAISSASAGIHYFDLTEDVATTKLIESLVTPAGPLMAPQCGLAPGLVGIIGAHLATRFEEVRNIKLRVGALPRHPTGLLGYSFIWSPAGVVNEYLNDCEVIENGERKWVSPMEWLETIHVNGERLEAFTTSGGLGTMCETFEGRVNNLDYKSMRYPGHADLMNFFFHELLMREDRARAEQILTHAKPPVDEDVVHIHVSAEGISNGQLLRREYVRSYYPREFDGVTWRAIAWTTASSVAGVIEHVASGKKPASGFLRQETIPLEQLLETQSGSAFREEQT